VQRQITPSPARSGSRARWSDRRDLGKLEPRFVVPLVARMTAISFAKLKLRRVRA